MSTLRAELVTDHVVLEQIADDWDALAVANRSPYAAPGWCLSWWRHAAPDGVELRSVVVRDADRVVAVAPLYCTAERRGAVSYRFLGAGVAPRTEPVAVPGFEAAAAQRIVTALEDAQPRPDTISFEGVPADSPWPTLLCRGWAAGEAKIQTTREMAAPYTTLAHADYDAWLAERSRNFRQQARRHRRQLLKAGASFRIAHTIEEAVKRLEDFERLHETRWRYRGGSGVLDQDIVAMLRDAAAALTPSGRFRLFLIEKEERVISAHVFVAAGGQSSYWLGGFDDDWASEQPSMQTLLAAVEHGLEAGEDRLDLGPGAQHYKTRMASDEEQLTWVTLFPPSRRRALSIARTVPGRLAEATRYKVFAAVPRHRKDQVKRLLRRVCG